MRKPEYLVLAFALAALFFGWKTWRALQPLPAAQHPATPSPQGVWQPGAVTADPPPPPDMTATVAAITGRPLFRQDRQKFQEGVAGVSARNYEAELARFTLLGVLSFGEDLKGLVVSKSGARTDRWEVKAGESFPGFTVKEVRTDSLLLTADGREFQLPLYAGPPTATGGAVRTDVHRAAPASASGATAPAQPATKAAPAAPATAPPAPAARPQPTAPVSPRDVRPRYTPGRR
jgi:hypothetical protein